MIRPALVMYVMIGMAWPVLGLSEDAAVADFLTPPDSIGTAYDTNPPPLASLKSILGSKPSQADLDLYVRSFARIAFEPEGDEKYPWILKWTK